MLFRSALLVAFLSVLQVPGHSEAALIQNSERGAVRRPEAELFREVLSEIKAKTRIPILLPSELPAPFREKAIRLVVGNGEVNKYEVSLYYDDPGSAASFVGYFAGETGRKPAERGKKVMLTNGKTGYFNAKRCGGSCGPSWIEWTQNNFVYTLQ